MSIDSKSWVKFALALMIISALSPMVNAAKTCREVFDGRPDKIKIPEKIKIEETIVTWYAPIAMPGDRWISRDRATGRRIIELFKPQGGYQNHTGLSKIGNVELMPDAPDDDRTYHAKMSFNRTTGEVSTQLHPFHETQKLSALVDKTVELTWETYLRQGTVTPEEIEAFKRTEAELAPQRKVNFVTTTLDGQTAAILRLYDGSPYPFAFFGASPTHFERVTGDPRLPIERRYPDLAIREESPYVFEAGRLAKVDTFDDGLEYQFYNLGSYLMTKFGFLGVGLPEYTRHGRIYIEITARHLKHYMRPREKGGMGFKIFAAARNGGEMTRVDPKASYESLGIDRNDKESKFVLFLGVPEFISNFYQKIELHNARDVYGDGFE